MLLALLTAGGDQHVWRAPIIGRERRLAEVVGIRDDTVIVVCGGEPMIPLR